MIMMCLAHFLAIKPCVLLFFLYNLAVVSCHSIFCFAIYDFNDGYKYYIFKLGATKRINGA